MDANPLMEILPIPTGLHGRHQDILGRHKGELTGEIALDHLGIDHHAIDDVQVNHQDRVDRQERLGENQAAIGAVVERPFHPLHRQGHRRRTFKTHHKAGQGTDSLTAHRIALIRHRGGTDLIFLERFFHLFVVGQDPQIRPELMAAGGDSGQDIENLRVKFTRVGLSGHGKRLLKTDLLAEFFLQELHLLVIPAEELQETGLCPGRPLISQGLGGRQTMLQIVHIHDQIVVPQAGALPHGRRLRRLKMGIAQAGHRAVLFGETPQAVDNRGQALGDELHGAAIQQGVGIVGDKTAGRAKMDNRTRLGGAVAKGMDMGHHVVAKFLLVGGRQGEIDIVEVLTHILEMVLGARQPQLGLDFGQRQPEPAPGPELLVGTEQLAHFPGGVALDEGIIVVEARL